MKYLVKILLLLLFLCGCSEKVSLDYGEIEQNDSNFDDINSEIETNNESINENVKDKDFLYRIRITSKIDTLNIRSSASTKDKSNIVGTTTCGNVYDVYENKVADGYTWHRIGVNQWIADDGTWTEKVDDNYVEEKIEFGSTNVGSIIFFGNYEQDNNTSNGREKVEWIVMEKTSDKILVLSKYGLDTCIYNNSYTTWGNSKIRDWLNTSFYDSLFTDQEKCYIEKTKNTSDTPNEKASSDYIFLFSSTEVEKYWPNENDRICYGTKYAFARGVEDFSSKARWWLRTVNVNEQKALTIRTSEGRINYVTSMDSSGYAVRPAMWINIK